jgi:hypothetical protein
MERREAVKYVSLLLGGTLVGATSFLTGCHTEEKHSGRAFTQDDYAYLDEIGETILPATSTPGAKAAKVGQFMTVMVNDCYTDKDQSIFKDGMDKINDLSKKKYDQAFMAINPQQRHDLLVQLDKEQKDYTKNKKPEDAAHYFRMMKELTLLGYFTSEIGCKQARRYVPVPGRYDGCIPYKKGDKAFAS